MPTHGEKRIIPYKPEQMFHLVADVAQYPDFLPWVKQATVSDQTPTSFRADLTIGYKFFTEKYSCRVNLTPHNRIDIDYLSGPFRHLNNHWIFTPTAKGGTEVNFFIDFEFNSSLFQTMMQAVFSEAVSHMIRAFEDRAQQIYKEAS